MTEQQDQQRPGDEIRQTVAAAAAVITLALEGNGNLWLALERARDLVARIEGELTAEGETL